MRLEEFLSEGRPLVQLEFVDNRALDSYLEQLRTLWDKTRRSTTFKLGIAIPFVKAEVATQPQGSPSEFEKFFQLLNALRESGQVVCGFPNSTNNVMQQGFYFTSGRATRFHIPKERLKPLQNDTDPVCGLCVRTRHQNQFKRHAGVSFS